MFLEQPALSGRLVVALLKYDSLRQNPAPDPVTKTPGGWSGDLVAPQQATFSWECDVNNGTDLRLQFSDLPVTGEMCNVFGFYAPVTSNGVFQCLSF